MTDQTCYVNCIQMCWESASLDSNWSSQLRDFQNLNVSDPPKLDQLSSSQDVA